MNRRWAGDDKVDTLLQKAPPPPHPPIRFCVLQLRRGAKAGRRQSVSQSVSQSSEAALQLGVSLVSFGRCEPGPPREPPTGTKRKTFSWVFGRSCCCRWGGFVIVCSWVWV